MNKHEPETSLVKSAHQGSRMMHRDGACCWVHPEEFQQKISEGWQFGGLPRRVDRSGSKNPGYGKNYHEGWVWIHRGSERQYVRSEDLDIWISKGYSRGMKSEGLDVISESQLRDYYKDHSEVDTAQHFGTSTYYIAKLLRLYGISRHTQAESRKLTAKADREKQYPHEKVIAFYEKHTATDTCKEFGFSVTILDAILDDYGVPRKDFSQVRACYAKDHPVSEELKGERNFRARQTKLEKYGTLFPGRDKTCLERYGGPSAFSDPLIHAKATATRCSRSSEIKESWTQKRSQTMLERYGVVSPLQSPEIQDKQKQTCLEKYGVPYNCMRKEARVAGNNSKPNQQFEFELAARGISYQREVSLESYTFDFQVGNKLVEVDPYPTHNSTWGVFGGAGKSLLYHQVKTQIATSHGFRCIHIFDWDEPSKILDCLVDPVHLVGARKARVQEVGAKEEKSFLEDYHLQGAVKSTVALGLYVENQLVQLMTFGKPRYNKRYQWELLRLCTKPGWAVSGGAERLFKAFQQKYSPVSILSYCDLSKFDGGVYLRLGFKSGKYPRPSRHWYNPKTKQHITDNLLRARGFDQLLGKQYGCYGKGTSNEELMRQHKFVEIYDCGQQQFQWHSLK